MNASLKAGALALALAGFALAPTAPASAATYGNSAPHISVTVGNGYHPMSSSFHPRHPRFHRVKVCTSSWHHHHRVTTCTWVNKRWM